MQQIIVYRNPLEAAVWNSLMQGEFFPIIVAIIIFFMVLFFQTVVSEVFKWKYNRYFRNAYLTLLAPSVAAIYVAYILFSAI